ncbi:MAG: peptidoglycan-binding protein, partial [Massilia sp.]
ARGELKGGSVFQVFRPAAPLKDPETGKVIGYEAVFLGAVKLTAAAKPGVDVHTFTVTSSAQEMGIGDLLLPMPPTPLISYAPHAPARPVKARVVSVYSGVNYAGQNQIVSINRGSIDGLDVASVMPLYHFGKVVEDKGGKKPYLGMGKSMIRLPDQQIGDLFIFRVFKNVSYGLIMQVTEPVEVGDVATSPE